MARARTIKQGFFTNDELGKLRPAVRLLFAGLWTLADRNGRLLDRPVKIKTEVLPYDHVDVDGALSELAKCGFIMRYEVDNTNCIQVVNWAKHQRPHPRETASDVPPPVGWAVARPWPEPDPGSPTAVARPHQSSAEPDLTRARTGSYTPVLGSYSPVSGPLAGPLAPPGDAALAGEDAPHPGANDEKTNGSTTVCCPFAEITHGVKHSEFCTTPHAV
jgi:hypothetical protein